MKLNPSFPRSGIMFKVLAYESTGDSLLGVGWMIISENGETQPPDLFDENGFKLPEGWYRLVITEEKFNVVIPRMIQ